MRVGLANDKGIHLSHHQTHEEKQLLQQIQHCIALEHKYEATGCVERIHNMKCYHLLLNYNFVCDSGTLTAARTSPN